MDTFSHFSVGICLSALLNPLQIYFLPQNSSNRHRPSCERASGTSRCSSSVHVWMQIWFSWHSLVLNGQKLLRSKVRFEGVLSGASWLPIEVAVSVSSYREAIAWLLKSTLFFSVLILSKPFSTEAFVGWSCWFFVFSFSIETYFW